MGTLLESSNELNPFHNKESKPVSQTFATFFPVEVSQGAQDLEEVIRALVGAENQKMKLMEIM